MNLICPQCGKENPRWRSAVCRADGCYLYLCSEKCASEHEHAKHMPKAVVVKTVATAITTAVSAQEPVPMLPEPPRDPVLVSLLNENRRRHEFDWNRAFDLGYLEQWYLKESKLLVA